MGVLSLLHADFFPQAFVVRDAAAEREIRRAFSVRKAVWPSTAHDFHYYKYFGTVPTLRRKCWSLRCRSVDECRTALQTLAGEGDRKIVAWRPSADREVMDGPAVYGACFPQSAWNLSAIRNGAVFEDFGRFYAVDFDAPRVYGSE